MTTGCHGRRPRSTTKNASGGTRTHCVRRTPTTRRSIGRCLSHKNATTAHSREARSFGRETLRPSQIEETVVAIASFISQPRMSDIARHANARNEPIGESRPDVFDGSCEGACTTARIWHPLHVETQGAVDAISLGHLAPYRDHCRLRGLYDCNAEIPVSGY